MNTWVMVGTLACALTFSIGGSSGPTPRVSAWNPPASSGWRLDKGKPPEYPSAALKQHLEGDVRLDVRISPVGVIDNYESVQGEKLLVEATKAAMSRWRFEPYTHGTRPGTAHVPVGVQFRLDLPISELLERAQGLTLVHHGERSDTVEVADEKDRANLAHALSQNGFLAKTGKGTSPPKGAEWSMSWRTQGRRIEVWFAEKNHRVVVSDEARRWSGDNGKRARALADELHRFVP